MNYFWLIIPLVIAFPLFALTLLVSIIASHVQKPVRLVNSETADYK
jgi:hypothetical protein